MTIVQRDVSRLDDSAASVGLFCLVATLAISGVTGAFFDGSPWLPPSFGGATSFVIGVVALILAISRALGEPYSRQIELLS
jgi:hypothetical protein